MESINIDLKITPGASKNEITGYKGKRLCIRIAAPPEDGKANECLCRFLAKVLGCTKNEVILIKGERSRFKTISIPEGCKNKII